MDLLSMLMGSMTTKESVEALSKKTGASAEQTEKLLASSLPLLVKGMTNNAAASSKGVDALRGALKQHTSTKKAADQISEADVEDGQKIVRHIFGSQTDQVVQVLAAENNLNEAQVTRGLSSMAPLLLSMLSAVIGKGAKFDLSDGLDLTDILALFGGSQQSTSNGMGLLGSMLGSGSNQTQNSGGGLLGNLFGGGLLGGLLGGSNTSSQSGGGLASLLGSMMGSSGSAGNAKTMNGTDLLSLLLGK